MSDNNDDMEVMLKTEVARALTAWRHHRGSFLVMMWCRRGWGAHPRRPVGVQ